MKSLEHCRDPGKARQNFIPANRDHVITTLVLCIIGSNQKYIKLYIKGQEDFEIKPVYIQSKMLTKRKSADMEHDNYPKP